MPFPTLRFPSNCPPASLLAFLALLASDLDAQAQAAPADPTDGQEQEPVEDEGWRLVDGIAVQAGNRVVTLKELDEARRLEMEAREVTQAKERDALTWNLIEVMATAYLEPQAGEDLGYDAELIRDNVHFTLAEDRRRAGAIAFSEQLESSGKSIVDYEEKNASNTYRDLWQRDILGFPSLPGERPTRDRFVRPGELKSIYRVFKDQLYPPTVQLQAIISPVAAWGGPEEARAGFEAIRKRALAGEDFASLEREFNAEGRDDLGKTPELPASQIQIPDLRLFALKGAEGEIGPVIDLEREGKRYMLLPKMLRRLQPDSGSFGDRTVQGELRQRLDNGRDNGILNSERARLLDRSFTWVHPALGHLKAASDELRAAQGQGPRG